MLFKRFLQDLAIRYLFEPQTSSEPKQLYPRLPDAEFFASASKIKLSKENQKFVDEIKKMLSPKIEKNIDLSADYLKQHNIKGHNSRLIPAIMAFLVF